MPPFKIHADHVPTGDQPTAIDHLVEGIQAGEPHITLLGATGTGKTFTIANVVERVQRPTIVMAPNKSLAAQLANEFREAFPENAVEYFVSLLRLLPARGLRPVHRHLHREGLVDQRRDRAPAALGDRGAADPARRPDRGERLVHLRPGLARGVRGPDPAGPQGRGDRHGVVQAAPRRHPVPAEPGEPGAREVPRPGRRPRDPSVVRGDRGPDRVVGRHDRADHAVRPDHRRGARGPHRDHGVPGLPLRRLRRADEAGRRLDRGGAPRAARAAREPEQAPRGRAPADADDLRPRDAPRGRVLLRHRELLAPHRRPRAGRGAVHAARLLPRRLARA